MASVEISSPPLSEVGREGFQGQTTKAARASMARGLVLFKVLVVIGIRPKESSSARHRVLTQPKPVCDSLSSGVLFFYTGPEICTRRSMQSKWSLSREWK